MTCRTGYLLLGMISTFVFRAVRDALPGNPAAQERIMGASFLALALADVTQCVSYLCHEFAQHRANLRVF